MNDQTAAELSALFHLIDKGTPDRHAARVKKAIANLSPEASAIWEANRPVDVRDLLRKKDSKK